LSFPEGGGVNDFIDEKFCQEKYASFDKVLGMISALGKGAELGKIDIQQAFRLLIVNPPKNVIKGDGPTVFLSAIGTPSS
jgi:hypothetical protein